MTGAAAATSWYLVHTKARDERRAAANLALGGIETFCPQLQRWGRRAQRNQVEPLFPGYLFAYFRPELRLSDVRFTRGVLSVVAFGGAPVPVDDAVAAIRERLGPDSTVLMQAPPRPGESVRVAEGPFVSVVGILDRPTPARQRVCVLLTAMACQARLVIDTRLLDCAHTRV
jgi:transcriptional antiterminator RfaH